MTTAMSTAALNPPPRAAVAAITNPANVPASLPSTRMAAARDRAQSWRGKYLLALNICPQDIELARRQAEKPAQLSSHGKGRLRAMSFHRSDLSDPGSISRSYSSSTEKEERERKTLDRSSKQLNPAARAQLLQPQQHRIHAVPLRAPSTGIASSTTSTGPGLPIPSASNPYGFAPRPGLARGRRCHTDPFELQDRVSAPIQIPSAMVTNNQLDGHDSYRRRSPTRRDSEASTCTQVKLLSWEEPVAMLAAADAVAKGWRMPHASEMSSMELGVRRDRHEVGNNPFDDDHMDDDDDKSLGGDIFEMDESDDEHEADNDEQPVGKSRRRYRTESMNIVNSGREKRTHHAFHDLLDAGGYVGRGQDLSQSFVPPHQLVNRSDCFSIGLRDEFKQRRPAPNL